jgi:DNA-binding LytR/AlgR family response regulator
MVVTEVRGRKVLIVEDEYLLAQDLTEYFRKLGAIVLGPAPSIEAATKKVADADAAVLDIDLNGHQVFPIADALMDRNVPFVFFTGRDDIAVPPRFRHVGRLPKPVDTKTVFDAIFPSSNRASVSEDANDVFAILPRIRLAALILMEDASAGDRLVELALKHALSNLAQRPVKCSLEVWLTEVLEEMHTRHGRDLLQ